MLTNDDLVAIGNIVDGKIAPVIKGLKKANRTINRVDKDMKLLTATLDIDVSRERKRVNKIEEYLENYSVPRFVAYVDPPSN
mgnify:CR=1 FL=1